MALDLLWSDDFAVLLGLKSSMFPDRNLPDGQELERQHRMRLYLKGNGRATQAQQDIIWSRFCAFYLPATVDRLLNLPTPVDAQTKEDHEIVPDFIADNPWHEMLVCVQHLPYVAKYLRSTSPIAAAGKQLPQVLADRLANISARWEKKMTAPTKTPDGKGKPYAEEKRQYYMSIAGSATQLLSTLCTHFINEPDRNTVISRETQKKLLPILSQWSRRYSGEFLGDVSLRMVAFMSKKWNEDFDTIRSLTKNWQVCGLPSCGVRKNLKVCGKCKTVRYCSTDHQTLDWATPNADGVSHKQVCFKTAY
ncbi:hypothetical protein DFH06DRAFT_1225825 [Mycena polygramma]|nr:hypothetical protein DFH06DRAFT_1225825 [Mycena polygramma]